VGAGLLVKCFYRLLQVDPGIQPDNLATLVLQAPPANYKEDPKAIALEHRILDRVSKLPGVTSAAVVNKLPVGDGDFTTAFKIVVQARDQAPRICAREGYFGGTDQWHAALRRP